MTSEPIQTGGTSEFEESPGRYFRQDPRGALLAEVTYTTSGGGGAYVITHTFVRPDLRGQGVARRLVDAVVARARAEGKHIVPACSYAYAVFEHDPSLSDIWQDSAD